MSITLYHHPFSRASSVVWMLEEVEQPYTLRHVDIMKGEQKTPDITKLNPMGKLPILVDGEQVVTEVAAIALYLADRYASGRLAPTLDDPARGTYLRWSFFAPSVIEPGSMAKAGKWDFKAGAAGWGNYDAMIDAIGAAIGNGDFILGEQFSMADVVFGGTLRYMTMFGMLEPSPALKAYIDRLNERPAMQRAEARNAAARKEHGLDQK